MKKKPSRTDSLIRRRGYDYALLPSAMAISAVEFADDLHNADVFAVAYGLHYWDQLHRTIPTITLLARSSEHLGKAFQQFEAWTSLSDGDAVELNFVFLSSGGYLLSLGPEPRRLEQRCLGFDRTSRALIASVTWIKEMTTVHASLLQFRKYCQQLISPFFLDGACYMGLTMGAVPDPIFIQEVPTLRKILKFSVEHVDEADIKEHTQAWVALNMHKHRAKMTKIGKMSRNKSKQFLLNTAHDARSEILSRHFPVTLERLRTNKDLQSMCTRLIATGLRAWQFEQAVCNLLLSADLTKGKPHFDGIPKNQIDNEIVIALQNRFEVANGDSKEILNLKEAQIVTQAIEDAKTLLAEAGTLPKKQDLSSVLEALKRRGLLDPPQSPK